MVEKSLVIILALVNRSSSFERKRGLWCSETIVHPLLNVIVEHLLGLELFNDVTQTTGSFVEPFNVPSIVPVETNK